MCFPSQAGYFSKMLNSNGKNAPLCEGLLSSYNMYNLYNFKPICTMHYVICSQMLFLKSYPSLQGSVYLTNDDAKAICQHCHSKLSCNQFTITVSPVICVFVVVVKCPCSQLFRVLSGLPEGNTL